MRIAIWLQGGIGGGNFSQGYPPLLDFVHRLSAHHDLTVYSIFPANDDFEPAGFRFVTWRSRNKSNRLRALALVFIFIRDHIKRPFDVIHAFWVYPAGTLVVLLGKLLRLPSIVTVQGGEAAAIHEIGYGNMLKPWLKRVTLSTCEHATCLNTISRFLVHGLEAHGLRRRDVIVTPFGPNTKRFPWRQRSIEPLLKLVHVANLTEVKDQVTLIKAFGKIQERIPAELHIVGADYLNGAIQQLVKIEGLEAKVFFHGACPHPEISNFLVESDIMLHTSLHEGQSGVVMEAMATGVVVCATPVGIVYDLGESFFRISPIGDYATMANNVIELARNKTLYQNLSRQCLEYATMFDIDWTVEQYNKMYETQAKA